MTPPTHTHLSLSWIQAELTHKLQLQLYHSDWLEEEEEGEVGSKVRMSLRNMSPCFSCLTVEMLQLLLVYQFLSWPPQTTTTVSVLPDENNVTLLPTGNVWGGTQLRQLKLPKTGECECVMVNLVRRTHTDVENKSLASWSLYYKCE